MQPSAPQPQPQIDPLAGDIASVNDYLRSSGLLSSVYFDFDSAELSSAAREQLAKNARFLQQHPEFVVTVEGHCDERGTEDYNLALGDRRASAAKGYLGTLGVTDGLSTMSFGEERPECRDSGEGCWSRNRRAQFVVVGRRG
jgi:peptidoglycan-associated lipoprotein